MRELVEEYFSFHDLIGGGDIVGFQPSIPKKKVAKVQEKKEVVKLELPQNLKELETEVKNFEGCSLKRFATNTVFGEGAPDAKILIIGEAPGEEEDINGVPFCGRSGMLLAKALNRVLGLKRDKNFYITNTVFWRPPGNRKPTDEELLSCRPLLEKIIHIINPELIICIGAISVQSIAGTSESVSALRRKELKCNFQFAKDLPKDLQIDLQKKVITLYHPAYLLRSPGKKREMYLDMLWLKRKYNNLFQTL